MTTEKCSWKVGDLLTVVDGAELVTIVRDIYLCVWYGGAEVEIYNITKPFAVPEIEPLRFGAERCLLAAHEAIDEFFIQLDVDFEDSCLTTPLWGVIVEVQSNNTLAEDN
jgi:hypothetical protein